MPAEVLFDWVALGACLAFGYVEESESGRVQATNVGKRALADIKKGDGPQEEIVLAFKIWIERVDDTGAVCDRHSLHYRFATEKSARLKADDLALPHVNRRYVEDGHFWEFTQADGTKIRIVVERA